jgi:RNA polymerase sigma-70 factor (ECF subfamily)
MSEMMTGKTGSLQAATQEITAAEIARCVAGDARAWEGLVATYHRRIFAHCYRFTGSHAEAEDMTQDIFVKLYCNLSSYDAGRGNFHHWLQNVTRNHLVDYFRRSRVARYSTSLDAAFEGEEDGLTLADRLMDSAPSQEERFADLELKLRVRTAVNQLSDASRETITLCALEECGNRETARLLKIQEGTVRSRLSRARVELAKLLQPVEPVGRAMRVGV